jgi:hypothetical protein
LGGGNRGPTNRDDGLRRCFHCERNRPEDSRQARRVFLPPFASGAKRRTGSCVLASSTDHLVFAAGAHRIIVQNCRHAVSWQYRTGNLICGTADFCVRAKRDFSDFRRNTRYSESFTHAAAVLSDSARKHLLRSMPCSYLQRYVIVRGFFRHAESARALRYAAFPNETDAKADELLALCRLFPTERMISWPVSPRVGNVKNDDARLVEPLPEAAE